MIGQPTPPLLRAVFAGALALTFPILHPAHAEMASDIADEAQTAPVVIDGEELFQVRGVSTYPAEKRAAAIAERIHALASDPAVSPDALSITETGGGARITSGEQLILTVYDADARIEGIERQILAKAHARRIGEAIEDFRKHRQPEILLHNGLVALAATVVLTVFLWLGARAMHRLDARLEQRMEGMLASVEAQSMRLLSAANLRRSLRGLSKLAWVATSLAVLVAYLKALQEIVWVDFRHFRGVAACTSVS